MILTEAERVTHLQHYFLNRLVHRMLDLYPGDYLDVDYFDPTTLTGARTRTLPSQGIYLELAVFFREINLPFYATCPEKYEKAFRALPPPIQEIHQGEADKAVAFLRQFISRPKVVREEKIRKPVAEKVDKPVKEPKAKKEPKPKKAAAKEPKIVKEPKPKKAAAKEPKIVKEPKEPKPKKVGRKPIADEPKPKNKTDKVEQPKPEECEEIPRLAVPDEKQFSQREITPCDEDLDPIIKELVRAIPRGSKCYIIEKRTEEVDIEAMRAEVRLEEESILGELFQ